MADLDALDAYAASGARGTIEHAQLVRMEALGRFADLGLVASVQPAHLLDDRDSTEALWPDRLDRCFALRSMAAAGIGGIGSGKSTVATRLRELGADYQETDPMSPNVIVDRNLYTGQNPASSEPLAQRILRDF